MTLAIPKPSLARLPIYYRNLKEALERDTSYMSSSELGRRAGVPAAQVRKDLSYLSQRGRSGVGYDVRALAAYLEGVLGLVNEKDAAMVGVGNLGRALALYPGFATYGLQIIVLFDNDPDKIGDEVAGLKILPVDKLTDFVERMGIRIGIITTPATAAQKVADAMIAGGVRAIWNFAPRRLDVPDGVFLKQEDLAASLAVLSHYVSQFKIAPEKEGDAVRG